MLDLDVAIENRGRATRVHIIPQTLYPEGALGRDPGEIENGSLTVHTPAAT